MATQTFVPGSCINIPCCICFSAKPTQDSKQNLLYSDSQSCCSAKTISPQSAEAWLRCYAAVSDPEYHGSKRAAAHSSL